MNPILARKSVAVTALGGLLGMTGYVIMQPFNGLDHSLQQAIAQLQSSFLTSVMKLVSTIGNPAIVLVVMTVLAVIFWRKQQRFESVWVLVTVVGGDFLAEIIKTITARQRPTHQLVPDTGLSFPSVHTLSAVLLVLLVLSLMTKGTQKFMVASVLGVIWIFLVALSRVYLRDHFPTDTIAAVFLGLFWWATTAIAFRKTLLRTQANTFLLKILPQK
ncbi:phosphatase PAP2 family protein [Leuconostoc lactis]|uniref:phosphatase PAP2 family protein n=1 Tax=Leuconostoc lactis TaxID=1246 RepID=UPI0025AF2AED|nr:phosphatase PAP2 family protein [Leuconostoc lactis]MDN2650060.1 phosphatase PAP2 family protein [Leuconostoc lactis]